MFFKGEGRQQHSWTQEQKLRYAMKLHDELNHNYNLISKLALICIKLGIKLVIENPYSTQHYLVRYWSIKCSIIDFDRTRRGDNLEKPTQYWFINCEPKNNFIFESMDVKSKQKIIKLNTVERSIIHEDYANRFIREYLIDLD